MKSDVEYLGIWIIKNFVNEQKDGSFHFVLNKDLYQNILVEMDVDDEYDEIP